MDEMNGHECNQDAIFGCILDVTANVLRNTICAPLGADLEIHNNTRIMCLNASYKAENIW